MARIEWVKIKNYWQKTERLLKHKYEKVAHGYYLLVSNILRVLLVLKWTTSQKTKKIKKDCKIKNRH